MRRLDLGNLASRYLSGEPISQIAKSLGVSGNAVRTNLEREGVKLRTVQEAQRLRYGSAPLDKDQIVAIYESGKSTLAIAKETGVNRATIVDILKERGIEVRDGSEANRVRMASATPEERLALTEAAHAAVRGVPHSEEHRSKIAQTVEDRGGRHPPSPHEEQFAAFMLTYHDLTMAREKAIGRYNIDFVLAESAIAVEIFGGAWHASGLHAERYRERLDYLINAGWLPVILWCPHWMPMTRAAADYVFALHEVRRAGKPAGSQEHVIYCHPDDGSVVEVEPTDRPVIPSLQAGPRARSDDPGFRE